MLVAATHMGGIMNADNGSYKEEVKKRRGAIGFSVAGQVLMWRKRGG